MPPVQLATGYFNTGSYHTPKYYRTEPQSLPRRKSAPARLFPEPRLQHDPLPSTGTFDPLVASVGYNGQWVTPEHPNMPLLWNSDHFQGIVGTSQGAGLANLGNTCFMNAALQALLYCPPVAALLGGKRHCAPKAQCIAKCVLCALQQLATTMLQKSGVVAPNQFRARLRDVCSGFRQGRQEDAHEFVRGLLDAITRLEVAGCAALRQGARVTREMEMRSNVHRLFGGMLQSCVQCTSCGHRSTNLEPFLDLSLEISRGKMGIIPGLKKFTAPERLDGDNQYRCGGCRKMVNANKRMTIRRAPNVLTIHIKRFTWDGKKTQGFVQYPDVLNLGPFMPGRPNSSAPRYRLTSVVVHAGTSRSGHYYSYVLGRDGRWYRKDDSQSLQVKADIVMRQHAYMLLYTRLPTPEGKLSADSPRERQQGMKRPRPTTPTQPTEPAQLATPPPFAKRPQLTAPQQPGRPPQSAKPVQRAKPPPPAKRLQPTAPQQPARLPQSAKPPQPATVPEPAVPSRPDEKAARRTTPPTPGKTEDPRPPPLPNKTIKKDRRKGTALLIGGSAAVRRILQRVFRIEAAVATAALRVKRKRVIDDGDGDGEGTREPEPAPKRFRFRRWHK